MRKHRAASLVEILIVMSIAGMLTLATMQLFVRASKVQELAMACGSQLRIVGAIELRLRDDLAEASTVRSDGRQQVTLQPKGSPRTIRYRCPSSKVLERIVLEGDRQVAQDRWPLHQAIEFEVKTEQASEGRSLVRLAMLPMPAGDAGAQLSERLEIVALGPPKVD
jgi:hypothetical protein